VSWRRIPSSRNPHFSSTWAGVVIDVADGFEALHAKSASHLDHRKR
jgi:hypothetical protein